MIVSTGSKTPAVRSSVIRSAKKLKKSEINNEIDENDTIDTTWLNELIDETKNGKFELTKSPHLNKAVSKVALAMSPKIKKKADEPKVELPFSQSPIANKGLSLSKFLSVIRSSLPSLEEEKKAAKDLITQDEKEKQDFALLEVPSIRNTAEEFLAIKIKF